MMKRRWIAGLLVAGLVTVLVGVRAIAQSRQDTVAAVSATTAASHGESRRVRVAQNAEVDERPNLDVPYVPTAPAVVDAMLKTTQVRKDDVVYDLGCGDGRIVITAAQRYGV